jgi:hypothetical protein
LQVGHIREVIAELAARRRKRLKILKKQAFFSAPFCTFSRQFRGLQLVVAFWARLWVSYPATLSSSTLRIGLIPFFCNASMARPSRHQGRGHKQHERQFFPQDWSQPIADTECNQNSKKSNRVAAPRLAQFVQAGPSACLRLHFSSLNSHCVALQFNIPRFPHLWTAFPPTRSRENLALLKLG